MTKIKISPISIIWLLALIYYKTELFLQMMIAVIIHELGHLISARVLKIPIKSFTLMPLGARMESAREISYTEEMIFSFSGPALGFLAGAISLALSKAFGNEPSLFSLALISFALSIFNLIPIGSLDGGRVLKCALFLLFKPSKASLLIRLVSFVCLFCIWLFSAYTLLKISSGLSMLVFCSVFFIKCFIFDTKNKDFESF